MKKKKFNISSIRILPIVMALCTVLLLAGCGPQSSGDGAQSSEGGETAGDMTDTIIADFQEFTEIPRPSHHEEKICDFLEDWAEEQSFEVVRDDYNNLVIEVPATEGMEDKTPVALQGHMDMVFAQKEGLNLDPETTPITMENDGEYLRSDGRTSLGADCGCGLALMRCAAEGYMEHGPLRLIITTDEEDSYSGVSNLDPDCVKDVKYMINLDNEPEGDVVISSASANLCNFKGENTSVSPEGDAAVEINLKDLWGGHSGDDINKKRLNGIIAMGRILQDIKDSGIEYQLASFEGGDAPNAIPPNAKAVLCINEKDLNKLSDCCRDTLETYREKHGKTDPDMKVEVAECNMPEKVMTNSDRDRILSLTGNIVDGIYTMSEAIDGLVESSSNLGVLQGDAEQFNAIALFRSSDVTRKNELGNKDKALGQKLGYETEVTEVAKPWPVKEDNHLAEICQETYRKLFDKEINVIALHAGLECGSFAEYNPDMEIISIGPSVYDMHSIRENVEIDSLNRTWKLLEGLLSAVE